jgi:glycosyltransferase involved in cell wall biosynthesis
MPALHQFSAGFSKGDAISNEARVLRALFRSWGCASEIFSETKRMAPDLRKDALDISEAPGRVRPQDIAILHLSIGSAVNQAFASLPCRKVILYHNITPPDYFRVLQEEIATHLRKGFEQVRALAGVADLNLAVSRFNAQELLLLGYRDVQVMPMMLERGQWDGPADRRLLDRFGDGRTNLLFVGRGAPNKRIEDLLNVLYYVQHYVDPEARLIHVGSFGGLERYQALLQAKAYELQLDRVEWLGSISMEGLRACYQSASVFLCMSEHEGFCIPLMEAMARGVPVVAYAAAAVPETLAGAGVLVREKRFDVIAETIGELMRRPDLRAAVVAGQKARVEHYLHQDFAGRWKALLAPLLERG